MRFHLDRSLRLATDTKHKSLYAWAINEVDQSGEVVGSDQIPWRWSLYFTATELVFAQELEIREPYRPSEGRGISRPLPGEPPEINHRAYINLKLRPGDSRKTPIQSRQTSYRMFGTDRIISDFTLTISPLDSENDTENCFAGGFVRETIDVDFRDEILNDSVYFYLKVKPSTFEQYAARISAGTAEQIVLLVGGVAGFYSEWSPSISTSEVKVLVRGEEHQLDVPADLDFEPPRLGSVGEARLYINTVRTPPAERSNEIDNRAIDDKYKLQPLAVDIKSEVKNNRQLRELAISTQGSMKWIVMLLAIIAISNFLN